MLLKCYTYFLMLSAGIPMIQNANEAKPPERKFAVGVLTYGKAVIGGLTTDALICVRK